ncbi:MAG: ThiF family adenylyltransferase [Deltaproteobacteria bacterium]|nr:ThiF family adenylyltransferase [Deltaproteobacteria bacterium]
MSPIVVKRELSRRAEKPRVLVIGAGGLGCPIVELLARVHVCELVLADGDVVDRSNLPRQWLYGDKDVGKAKTAAAAARVRDLAPGAKVETRGVFRLPDRLDFALVIDGTDDVDFKFALNDAAIAARVPLVSGGVVGLVGYALSVRPGQSACLRCVFEAPTDEMRKTCRDAGVLAPLPSIVGSVMAAMAARTLAGEAPEAMWSIDLGLSQARPSRWQRRDDCPACGRPS